MFYRKIAGVLVLAVCLSASGGTPDVGLITLITTPVEVHFDTSPPSYGSGFFYFVFGKDEGDKSTPHWVPINKIYLITAKHVIAPQQMAKLNYLEFALRKSTPNAIEWLKLHIARKDLFQLLHIDKQKEADVAAIDVTDLVMSTISAGEPARTEGQSTEFGLQVFQGVSKQNFPGVSKVRVEAGDDVIT